MMKKIENLLKTSYARITTSEEPNEKKWVFSSVHNRAFNYNSSALFEYVKKYHPEIQACNGRSGGTKKTAGVFWERVYY